MDVNSSSWPVSPSRNGTNVTDIKPLTWRDGFRIVDLNEMAKQMHCKECTALLDLDKTQNETRFGLASVLSVLCDCGTLNDVCTAKIQRIDEGKAMFEVNAKASVNMLLFGAGAQHIINFLAVLDIPMPVPDDTSLVVPSSPDDAASLPSPVPSSTTTTTSPTTPAYVNQSQNEKEDSKEVSLNLLAGSEITLIPSAEIKEERVEDSKKSCNQDSPDLLTKPIKNGKSKKRNELTMPPSKAQKKSESESVSEASNNTLPVEADNKVEPEAEFGEVSFEATDAKPKERKYYRCPLCPRILPSSRGFNIHVGRKHQASNYQVEHFELGPNAGYTGTKAQDAVGEDALPVPLSFLVQDVIKQVEGQSMLGEGEINPVSVPVPSTSEQSETNEDNHMDKLSDQSLKCTTVSASSDLGNEVRSKASNVRRSSERRKRNAGASAASSHFVCQIRNCGKKYKARSLYKKHLRKVHHVDSPVVCDKCELEFDAVINLKKHMTFAHRTKEEKKVECKYCGDTLPHGGALKRHIKANHPRGSKRTIFCDECPMTFARPCDLKAHKLRHSGAKNYKCFYCDMWFAGAGNRLSHIRYIHNKERKFLCETCGASFHRAHVLREHERVHSGEKPFQCERCAERFTKKEYLTIHMRTHTGERPYKCELCDKAFTQRCSRSLHRRKVHGTPKQERRYSSKLLEVPLKNEVIYMNTTM